MHDLLAPADIFEAEVNLGAVSGVVTAAFTSWQKEVKLAQLGIKSSDKKEQEIIDLFADCDVETVLNLCQGMAGAITRHKFLRCKDWTVESMDIQLL